MSLRQIQKIEMPGLDPAAVDADYPELVIANPEELFVDEDYQRNLSDRSIALIRRIFANWSWRAFKPPVCSRVDGKLHVLDGQHTAIAAASHPQVGEIPVLVVPDGDRLDRAMAFVRHNRDRLQVTPQQMHFALLAAGDEDALTMQRTCDHAGARILRHPPSYARFAVGDLMCIGTLRAVLARRYAHGARRVLETCVRGQLAPISADAVKAVEELFFGDAYSGRVDADDLELTIRELGALAEKDAKKFCAEHDLPLWKGLTVVWFRALKGARRVKRAAEAEAALPPRPAAEPPVELRQAPAPVATAPPPPIVAAPVVPVDPRAALGVNGDLPRHIGGLQFSAEETTLIEALLARPQARRKHLLEAIYDGAETDERRVETVVQGARMKLARVGVAIEASGGKMRMRTLLEKAKGGVA